MERFHEFDGPNRPFYSEAERNGKAAGRLGWGLEMKGEAGRRLKSDNFWIHVKYGEQGIDQPWFHRLCVHKQRK